MQVAPSIAPVLKNSNAESNNPNIEKKDLEDKKQTSLSKKTSSFPGNSKLGKKNMPPKPLFSFL